MTQEYNQLSKLNFVRLDTYLQQELVKDIS